MSSFFVREKISQSRGITTEDFMVVENAVLARTGTQLYSDKEVPVTGDSRGMVLVDRTADEVFSDRTLASLQGKPLTLDHPDEDVTPANYREHLVGVVINPRRGERIQDHLLLADLMIYDAKVIAAVNNGDIRELSVGYDAAYIEDSIGRGHQTNIVANHLALVREGRCGPICRIGDSAYFSTRDSMVHPSRRKQLHIHLHR